MDKKIVTVLSLDASNFKSKFGDAEKSVLKFSGSITALGVAALGMAKMTANFQDATIKAARSAGTSAENFSAMAHAAEMSGATTEQLTKAYSKLTAITPAVADSLGKVGISLRSSTGELKTADVLFNDVANKMKSLKNPSDQAALAVKVFGEEGTKLVSMLKDGAGGLDAMRKEAELLGVVVSTKAGEAAEKFNDDMARTAKTVQGLGNAISESIIQFANQSGFMDEVREKIQGVTRWWRGLSDETKNLIVKIGSFVVAGAGIITVLMGVVAIAPLVGGAFTIMFGPIGAIIAGIALLTAGVIKFWDQLQGTVGPVISMLESFWDDIKKTFDDVKKSLSSFFEQFTSGAEGGVESISVFGTITNVIMKSVSSSMLVAILPFRVMFDILKGLITAMTSFGKAAWQAMRGDFSDAFETAKQGLVDIKDTAVKVGEDVIDAGIKLKNIWTSDYLVKNIKETAKNTGKVTLANKELKKSLDTTSQAVKLHEGYVSDLEKSYKEYLEVLKSVRGGGKATAKDITIALVNIADAAAKVGKTLNDAFAGLMETYVSDIKYAASVSLRDLDKLAADTKAIYEKQKSDLESSENAKIQAIESAYDKQIDALRYGENAKTALLEMGMNERLLLIDNEYQNAKALAEANFAADMERERANFEIEKALLLEKSIDKEQRRFVELELDNDFKNFLKNEEANFQATLSDLQKNYLTNRKDAETGFKDEIKANEILHKDEIEALTKEKALALEAAELDKNNKLKNLDDARTKQEKDQEKQRLEIQYKAEVQSFEQTKAAKIADTIVSGISGAAQAFSSLASIPFVGVGLGVIAAATILGATYKSVSQINSQVPIKPAGLLEDGGFIGGNTSHSQGGLAANIESGEFVIDKQRTAQMYKMIDNGASGGITINFHQGAIVGTNMTSEEIARNVSLMVVQEIRRQGVVN